MKEDYFPLLAFKYHMSLRRDLGRPKQRWKYQETLQDKERQVFDGDDDDDDRTKICKALS
jgi:hypothetical protein